MAQAIIVDTMTKVKSITPHGGWQRALNAARLTANKAPLDKEPSREWRVNMLRGEHSPIRLVEYDIVFEDMPYFVQNHLVRHKFGVEHFVGTQRDDRNDNPIPRADKPQGAPVTMMMSLNAQAIMNISRKRLCNKASSETKEAWEMAIEELEHIDPILAKFCVPQCVHCGYCPEMQCCGYVRSKRYDREREEYLNDYILTE